ncbi:hypothetical protein GGR56DRAFT_677733 [Xylariaceae sp. FL0804]|nr:hypothetical protein GGR56DRAFT_677733 [Xylariaceae sp. FL0804]
MASSKAVESEQVEGVSPAYSLLAELDSQEAGAAPRPNLEEAPSPGAVIKEYLLERSEEFRRLCELQKKGWDNPAGDRFFARQRKKADNPDARRAQYFYEMMRHIGQELEDATGGFSIRTRGPEPAAVLDLCAAPGGFLETILRLNPGARAVGFSLPEDAGGYAVLVPERPGVRLEALDVTMLAADLGVAAGDVPAAHPDRDAFLLRRRLEPAARFDLAVCGGSVLRTHARATYRDREALRLMSAQLALGLGHLRPGGTLVVLLHHLAARHTVALLHRLSGFATLRLFKPRRSHAMRSSFYLVAADVRAQAPEATRAVELWRAAWRVATFGTDEEYAAARSRTEADGDVEALLRGFGPELVRMGRPIWKIQADALARASFVQ